MSNIFQKASHKIENSPWVFIIFLLFVYGFYLGTQFWLEDYAANLGAYQMIPTRKAMGGMVENMARFLQIAPIMFGYLYLRDTNKVSNAGISLIFLAVDWGIGVYFRGYGLPLTWLAYAAVEDFVFFTLGSEVLLVVSFGMVMALIKPAFMQVIHAFEAVFGMGSSSGAVSFGSSGPAVPPPPKRPPPQPPNSPKRGKPINLDDLIGGGDEENFTRR